MQPRTEAVRLGDLTHDESRKQYRVHPGLIAQDVAAVMQRSTSTFGGFQDHSLKGGDVVSSLGYEEFIAPLGKAVQRLAAPSEALTTQGRRTGERTPGGHREAGGAPAKLAQRSCHVERAFP